jgi:sortase (surface protein transpeptidase)
MSVAALSRLAVTRGIIFTSAVLVLAGCTVTKVSDQASSPPDAAWAPVSAAVRPPGPEGKVPTRLIIPRINVNAGIELKGLDPNLRMQAPEDPHKVAWYTFTAMPGTIGNAVFSGHLDYYNLGRAVFADLHNLRPGDLIEVDAQNGSVNRYRVARGQAYNAVTAPVDEIIGRTRNVSITLYTCAGNFNRAAGEYDERFVIRGERA